MVSPERSTRRPSGLLLSAMEGGAAPTRPGTSTSGRSMAGECFLGRWVDPVCRRPAMPSQARPATGRQACSSGHRRTERSRAGEAPAGARRRPWTDWTTRPGRGDPPSRCGWRRATSTTSVVRELWETVDKGEYGVPCAMGLCREGRTETAARAAHAPSELCGSAVAGRRTTPGVARSSRRRPGWAPQHHIRLVKCGFACSRMCILGRCRAVSQAHPQRVHL